VRTCSLNLSLRLTVALVCMKESRPGDGRLYFCHPDHCNSAHSIGGDSVGILLSAIFVGILLPVARDLVGDSETRGKFNEARSFTLTGLKRCEIGVNKNLNANGSRRIKPTVLKWCGIRAIKNGTRRFETTVFKKLGETRQIKFLKKYGRSKFRCTALKQYDTLWIGNRNSKLNGRRRFGPTKIRQNFNKKETLKLILHWHTPSHA